jgi:hypothetical protein
MDPHVFLDFGFLQIKFKKLLNSSLLQPPLSAREEGEAIILAIFEISSQEPLAVPEKGLLAGNTALDSPDKDFPAF